MDFQIVYFLNQLGQGSFLYTITAIVSYIPLLILLWLTFGMIALRYDKKRGRLVFLSIIVAVLIYFVVNDFIFKSLLIEFFGTRLRPYLAHPGEILAIGARFVDSSFPSGHVASSTAVLGVLIYFYKKYWAFALMFILFMMFARMHMGMHYPSDVLAGFAFGLVYAFLGIQTAKYILEKK